MEHHLEWSDVKFGQFNLKFLKKKDKSDDFFSEKGKNWPSGRNFFAKKNQEYFFLVVEHQKFFGWIQNFREKKNFYGGPASLLSLPDLAQRLKCGEGEA